MVQVLENDLDNNLCRCSLECYQGMAWANVDIAELGRMLGVLAIADTVEPGASAMERGGACEVLQPGLAP